MMFNLFLFFKEHWYEVVIGLVIFIVLSFVLYSRHVSRTNLDKIDEVIKETIAESLKDDSEVVKKIDALSEQIKDIEAKIEKSMEKRDEVHNAIETSFSLDDIDDIIYGGNECSD